MRNQTARTVALTGLLFALAMALSYAESMLVPLMGLPPGVKIGLANIVVMYALLFASRGQAFLLVLLKAAFSLFTRGALAGLLSLCGGTVSFLLMALLLLVRPKLSVLLISVAGSLGHNLGQFAATRLLLGPMLWYYLPVLLLSGIAMGVLTALTLRVLLPALQKTGATGGTAPPPPNPTHDTEGGPP